MEGQTVGASGDTTCAERSSINRAGIDPAHPAFAQFAFYESPLINCYETKKGGCELGGRCAAR
jgi:hypothetical protein